MSETATKHTQLTLTANQQVVLDKVLTHYEPGGLHPIDTLKNVFRLSFVKEDETFKAAYVSLDARQELEVLQAFIDVELAGESK